MAGHSKWNNIKNKKGKADAQRGKIFTKIGREIAVAVKEGGPNPEGNSRLKDVIAKAKASNMPNDNIERSIKKAAGGADGANYEEINYEGYGPSGVAVIIEVVTDNKNRTAGEIRHLFDKYGGNLGSTGCVNWMFDRKGILIIEKKEGIDEDELMMEAIEAGAEDFAIEEEYYEIVTLTEDFSLVRDSLEDKGFSFASAELEYIPQNLVKLGEEDIEKMEKLIEFVEDNDDVQNIWHNWEEPQE